MIQKESYIFNIAANFYASTKIDYINELTLGNINRTFLVTLKPSEGSRAFILQQMNSAIFSCPDVIMHNWLQVCSHIKEKLNSQSNQIPLINWKVPEIITTLRSEAYWVVKDKCYWRALKYIESSKEKYITSTSFRAKEIGYALGFFHNLISDLDVNKLSYSIRNFHDMGYTLGQYDANQKASVNTLGFTQSMRNRIDKLKIGVLCSFDQGSKILNFISNQKKILFFVFD